jgi:PKHD-type hydroxylase
MYALPVPGASEQTMRIVIGNVLSADDLRELRAALAAAHFTDGRETAGFAAREVKHNLQAVTDQGLDAARKMVTDRILANQVFGLAVRPKALSLMFSRYDPGMRYGTHVDDAIMRGMRTDVAFTLFVSDPETYEGGELVIDSAASEEPINSRPARSLPIRRRVCTAWRK